MDLKHVKAVDEMFRNEDAPVIDREIYDGWSQEIASGNFTAIAGVMGAPGTTVGKLRHIQEIKEQLGNDVFLGPSYPLAIGRATLYVYGLVS